MFSNKEYKTYLLNFIISNNLPFSIVDSTSFNSLLRYLKDNLVSISRRVLKEDLDNLYNKKFLEIKSILSKNNSKFILTLDKQNSSNNIDFLAVTIHYYNNNLELENYLIRFKNLNNNKSYIGLILYKFLNKILKNYKIKKNILSITRDNTSSINTLVEYI